MGTGLDISNLISRAPADLHTLGGGSDTWNEQHGSPFKVPGRYVLNVWRVMRASLTLNIYSFEEVAFHLFHARYASALTTSVCSQSF